MIELDLELRRLAWPGASCGGLPSSMAEHPSRIWFHVACLQRSREVISREGISCRAVRSMCGILAVSSTMGWTTL